MSQDRVCPVCGDFRFGSMVLADGTMQRRCHGEMYFSKATGERLAPSSALREEFRQAALAQREASFEIRSCTHTWHQSEDEANGLEYFEPGGVVGTPRPVVR